jgi:hypothetical protein
MSSHREAPEISKDPVADSADLYAFVSPDHPDTVTLIATYVPLPLPAGGPNFFEFGDDVLYEIHVDSNGDGRPDLTYQFRFRTELRNDRTFLYNTGPIESLDSENWNRRQFYSVTKVDAGGKHTVLAEKLPCPPCHAGPLSIPDYDKLAEDAVHKLRTGEKVFAGQRADPFFVDLGAIFDLGTLRPLQDQPLVGQKLFDFAGKAVDATDQRNVHSIAVQLPLHYVRKDGKKKVRGRDPGAVIGVWTSASRRQVQVRHGRKNDDDVYVGPQVQVSRLGNPLFNEVIVPMAPTARADLVAILLTGIPDGLIENFQNNTGDVRADMLRLNTAVPPTTEDPNAFGVLGGDLAGFPNGRRVADDVVSISLRAIAGATVPLVDEKFQPDAAAALVEPGLTARDASAELLKKFPYLGVPFDGFTNPGPAHE